jgi:hypothetical protein
LFRSENARIFFDLLPELARQRAAEWPFKRATTLHFSEKMLFQLTRALSNGG